MAESKAVEFPLNILQAIVGMLQSKRVLMTIIGLVAVLFVTYIPGLADYETAIVEILAIVGAFILSQIFPDWGVEKLAEKHGVVARSFKTNFFESKKVATALTALVVAIVLHFFPTIPEEAITAVVLAFISIIGSQGLIDTGKEAAKIDAVYG